MRVKIGNNWFSDNDMPICVELDEKDKQLISKMENKSSRLAKFPHGCGWDVNEREMWMNGEGKHPNPLT